jgi:hypothetical protein
MGGLFSRYEETIGMETYGMLGNLNTFFERFEIVVRIGQ